MEIWCMFVWCSLMQQQQQRSTGLTSVALSDEELMSVQQQQTPQQQQIQQQSSVPSYGDYAGFDAASLGQMSTATVSAVDQPDTSRIDELVVPLSTTTAIMSSMSALEQTASSLIYMDPDTSYATSMKDTRSLLNEQTNVCKVRHLSSLILACLKMWSWLSLKIHIRSFHGFHYRLLLWCSDCSGNTLDSINVVTLR